MAEAAAQGREARVQAWLAALERRHLAVLSFAELRRALTALSALYVERRGSRLEQGDALGSAGKRAAFALFYGALHFECVRRIVRQLPETALAPAGIVDIGCGTGVAGAAWAIESGGRSRIEGIDRSGWALAEARWNWTRLGLSGHAQRGDLVSVPWPGATPAIVLAYVVNELPESVRSHLLARLGEEAARGARVLVVEPLSRRVAPWWDGWVERLGRAGARADEWRFRWEPSPTLALLDRAAGLSHREIGARSIWLG